jgi:hypothetical protein
MKCLFDDRLDSTSQAWTWDEYRHAKVFSTIISSISARNDFMILWFNDLMAFHSLVTCDLRLKSRLVRHDSLACSTIPFASIGCPRHHPIVATDAIPHSTQLTSPHLCWMGLKMTSFSVINTN